MGDRGQDLTKDEGIHLYTHWAASELGRHVQRAPARRLRWNDPEYLARILFDAMKGGDTDGETGYGIGSSKRGDIWRLITLDCENQKIIIEDHDKVKAEHTFGRFTNLSDEDINKLNNGEDDED